jgi:riboflavin biosynthesis pyrimidine reductase
VREFESRGISITAIPLDDTGKLDLRLVLNHLGVLGVSHLLVEPGPTLAQSFISASLVDRVWIFRSPNRVDDPEARSAVPVEYPTTGRAELEGDTLTEYLNPKSPTYFSLDPSPDFALIK